MAGFGKGGLGRLKAMFEQEAKAASQASWDRDVAALSSSRRPEARGMTPTRMGVPNGEKFSLDDPKFGGGSGLDMSQEARMARAREMGFDVDTPLYHGTKEPPFSAFDLSRSGENAGELGAIYFAHDKEFANRWAGLHTPWAKPDAHVFEGYARLKNPKTVQGDGLRRFDPLPADEINAARDAGHDGVAFRNFDDGGEGVGDYTVVFDPRNVRSKRAAFDPSKKDSPDLLASALLGTAAAGGATIAGAEDAEAARLPGILDLPKMMASKSARPAGEVANDFPLTFAKGGGKELAPANDVAARSQSDLFADAVLRQKTEKFNQQYSDFGEPSELVRSFMRDAGNDPVRAIELMQGEIDWLTKRPSDNAFRKEQIANYRAAIASLSGRPRLVPDPSKLLPLGLGALGGATALGSGEAEAARLPKLTGEFAALDKDLARRARSRQSNGLVEGAITAAAKPFSGSKLDTLSQFTEAPSATKRLLTGKDGHQVSLPNLLGVPAAAGAAAGTLYGVGGEPLMDEFTLEAQQQKFYNDASKRTQQLREDYFKPHDPWEEAAKQQIFNEKLTPSEQFNSWISPFFEAAAANMDFGALQNPWAGESRKQLTGQDVRRTQEATQAGAEAYPLWAQSRAQQPIDLLGDALEMADPTWFGVGAARDWVDKRKTKRQALAAGLQKRKN